MNRLIELGFIKVGYWNLVDFKINFVLSSHGEEKDVLYSYVSNGQIYYIGKTTRSLEQRLKGYQRPGPTQKTNIRVNKSILYHLERALPIDIYILPDPESLKYRGYKISLAGGLEDTLIDVFKPEWNITGKRIVIHHPENHKLKRLNPKGPLGIESSSFKVTLFPTYYNQGFFNVRRIYSDRLGEDQGIIKIQLGQDRSLCIDGLIDRRANQNGSPRILGRKPLKEWIKSNFNQGDVLVIEILSPNSIKLH